MITRLPTKSIIVPFIKSRFSIYFKDIISNEVSPRLLNNFICSCWNTTCYVWLGRHFIVIALNTIVRHLPLTIAAHLHSTKPELSNGEDLWQKSRLEIRLNAFRQSTIPLKHFIIIIIIDHIMLKCPDTSFEGFMILLKKKTINLNYASKNFYQ